MLYLDIQHGEEAVNTLGYQHNIGGGVACMNIIVKGKKGCGQLSSSENFFSDNWFSGVQTVEKDSAEVIDCCGPVKTGRRGFCLARVVGSISSCYE